MSKLLILVIGIIGLCSASPANPQGVSNGVPASDFIFDGDANGVAGGEAIFQDNKLTGEKGNGLAVLSGFLEGDALTSEQMALVAEKLGGIVVYIFSYLFMGVVFLSYIFGVVILMIFKIMFGAFVEVQPIEQAPMPVTDAPSANPYQSGAAYQPPEVQPQRYVRSVEYSLDREARALTPYTNDRHINYLDADLGLYDKTKAFVNRGYATGLYLYDVLTNPECQQYIMCQAASRFSDERVEGVKFKDMFRQVASSAGSLNQRLARSVDVGIITQECDSDEAMRCAALKPAFSKMNDLLSYFGMEG